MNTKLPHEIKSEETKKKILTAMDQMLSQYDFKYLTVRNICEQAGVAYGSFYHHFSSKENVLYLYVRHLYQRNLELNPIPAWIHEHDYIRRALWYIEVLGFFCEAAGRDLIGYVYKNSPQGIFKESLMEQIAPILHAADEKGYIDRGRDKADTPSVDFLIKDIEILGDGTILWWSCSAEEREPLHETLEHLCFNMLFSFCSDAFRQTDFPRRLLTELPDFEGAIKIQGVPAAQANI